jgi:hypothetical protein
MIATLFQFHHQINEGVDRTFDAFAQLFVVFRQNPFVVLSLLR